MLALAYLALFGIPLLAALIILGYRGSTTAVAACLIGGWMSMPLLRLRYDGIPQLDKESLLGAAVFLATCLARPRSRDSARLRWLDLPMIAWCLVPIASSVHNGLGVYDGFSSTLRQFLVFGAPYATGRMICTNRAEIGQIGRVLLLAVAAYTPLCLIESRLSPQLHQWIFALPGRVGWERVTFFGPFQWKPSVFLQSPLELTPLMGIGFLFGWWMLRRRRMRTVAGFSMPLLVGVAFVATLMGKSLGGVALTLAGMIALWVGYRFQTRAALLGLLLVAPCYVVSRTAGLWNGAELVQFVEEHISVRRAESLEFRMVNEDRLIARALVQPMLGWGGWGRNRVYDENGRDLTVTDGLWVMTLGTNGQVGLTLWLATLALPVLLVLKRLRARTAWLDPSNAGVLYCAVVLCLHTIDCLANAMTNPVYFLLAGGLTTVMASHARRATTRARKPRTVLESRPATAAIPVATLE